MNYCGGMTTLRWQLTDYGEILTALLSTFLRLALIGARHASWRRLWGNPPMRTRSLRNTAFPAIVIVIALDILIIILLNRLG